VVTAYQVCNSNIGKAGSSTAFHQEWHLLRLSGHLKPNPRKTFIVDLIKEINKWKSEGAQVILGGDFNENLGDTIDGLSHLASICSLTDVHTLFMEFLMSQTPTFEAASVYTMPLQRKGCYPLYGAAT
jgi:hypothetical protein